MYMEDMLKNKKESIMEGDKRILWINPSFLDYRIPLYSELQKAYDGNFYLIYSKDRVPERCHKKITELLGANTLYIKNEKSLKLGYEYTFANKGVKIPFPKGLYHKIKSVKPQLIIAEGFFQYTPWAVWYSFIHRIPLLIAYERTAHTERNCPFYRRWYRKFINIFVSGYVVNGQLTKEYLISQGVKPENIFTGGMCADSIGLSQDVATLSIVDRSSIKEKLLGEQNSGLVYIYVGQLINRKGVNFLLDAWLNHIEIFPEDRLVIVGNGTLLEKYKEQYSDSSIIFTGSVEYSLIYKYYAISDVFIIPTLEDNWSLVVPEAMACGLPIACSIYNGCHPELVKKDENGITFDPLNKDSVIETLAYFHSQDLKAMGKRSIKIEKTYSPYNVAQNIIKAVNKYI